MNTEKIGAGLAALVISLAFFGLALNLRVPLDYSDFVVGSTTWYAGNKFQDLIAWPVFIFSLVIAYTSFTTVMQSMREKHGAEVSTRLAGQFVLWSLPYFAAAAALYWASKIESKVTTLSATGIIAVGTVAFLQRKAQDRPNPDFWGASLLALLLVSMIPLELGVLLSRLPMSLVGHLDPRLFFDVSYVLCLASLITGAFVVGRYPKVVEEHYRKLLLIAQTGLPLFYLTLLPARLSLPTGELTKYETTTLLRIVVVLFVLCGIFDVARRFRSASPDESLKAPFSPFALFGLFIALKLGNTVAPHISPDDYHFGENLLGMWSYLQGYVPYVDYLPAHGIVENDLRSTISMLFYDGTAGTIAEAGRMTFVILGFAAFVSIYRTTGSLVLAFVALLPLGHRFAWIFVIPFICLWLSSSLRAQPAKWLIVYGITAPIVILAVPPQGVVVVAAFGILALKLAWDQVRTGDRKSWKQLLLVAGLVLAFAIVTPLFWMILGAVQYVLENGQINQQAYGIPWMLSWYAEVKGYAFEAIRNSWFVIPLVGLYFSHAHYKEFKDSRSAFYTALVLIAFSFLMIPYSMGRIDPGGISRVGLMSIFSWSVLFPLLTWGSVKVEVRPLVILLVVVMTSLSGAGVSSLASLASVSTQSVPTAQIRDADAAGVPNVGNAYVDDDQWDRIIRLDTLLEARLAPQEQYLDLTSRNAHYFYVNRLPPVPVSAPFNLVHPAQERSAVEMLRQKLPKLSLLQADNIIHDGGGLALRNPRLYRFVVDNYVPVMERGFIVGYRKVDLGENDGIIAEVTVRDKIGVGREVIEFSDKELTGMLVIGDRVRINSDDIRFIERIDVGAGVIELNGGPLPTPKTFAENLVEIEVSPRVYREYTASLLQRSFSLYDLQKIPVSWGRAERSLDKKMTIVQSLEETPRSLHGLNDQDGFYKVNGSEPQVRLDLSGLGLSGRDAGLLKFGFTCADRKTDIRIRLWWWGDDRNGPIEESRIVFTADNGTMIVPLDASPWWLTLSRINGITMELEDPAACSSFRVQDLGLYQRSY